MSYPDDFNPFASVQNLAHFLEHEGYAHKGKRGLVVDEGGVAFLLCRIAVDLHAVREQLKRP